MKQKDMDMSSYTEEFMKLCVRTKVKESEDEKVARYLNGLIFIIQEDLNIHTSEIVQKCFQLALKVEENLKRRHEKNGRGKGRQQRGVRGTFRGRGNGFGYQGDSNQEDSRGENSCNQGGGYNPRGSFRGRRPPSRGRYQVRGPPRCYNCNQEGHMANRCLEKATSSMGERRSNLVQESDCQSVESATTYQSVNAPDSYGYPKRGEALMMRRAITTMKVPDKEPPQRKSLFKTTCKAGEKVCKVLIDSRSTKKFVSLEMVEKLKLRRLPHPYPYKVSWLTQGHQAVVEEQAWVEFQIGSYKDRFLFDIAKMDACHLLFGRPWHYELKTHHDGLRNTYSITKDGKVIEILLLIEEETESKGKDAKVLMVEGK